MSDDEEAQQNYKVGRHHQKQLIDKHVQVSKVAPTSPQQRKGDGIEGTIGTRQDSEPEETSSHHSKIGSNFDLADALLGPRDKSLTPFKQLMNKGDISNIITFVIFLIGLAIRGTANENNKAEIYLTNLVMSVGLFGFSGGITNWLAIKMLFDKVGFGEYYLWGSGVIPRQFKEIREALKNMIMKMFFEKEFLEKYLDDRAKSILERIDFGEKLNHAMAEPEFDQMLEDKLNELSTKPEGMLVNTLAPMFGGISGMVPMLKPFLGAFGEEMLKALTQRLSIHDMISIETVIEEVELLLNEKLKLITPEMVKELLEEVIREHLGWLVVWGNIFGGFIGLISALSGYGI